jgi:hypothetical protein
MAGIRSAVAGAVALGLALAGTGVALAHHGWSWTSAGVFILKGKIVQAYYGNPHSQLTVAAEDGEWTVDLSPPLRASAAGFVEGVAAVGDDVIAIGNRAIDGNKRHMKARRIVIGGAGYDVYPNDYPPDLGI